MSLIADPPQLINNATVRQELNLKPDQDSTVSALQISSIQLLEAYVGRLFARRDGFVWTHRIRRPRKTLYLGIMPVLSITEALYAPPGQAIATGDALIEDSDFEVVDQQRSQVQKLCPSDTSFSDFTIDSTKFYKGYFRFTMNGGYGPAPTGSADATVELPAKIKEAILIQMQFMLQRNQVQGDKLISSNINLGEGGSISLVSPKKIHPQAQNLLNGYRQFWQ